METVHVLLCLAAVCSVVMADHGHDGDTSHLGDNVAYRPGELSWLEPS